MTTSHPTRRESPVTASTLRRQGAAALRLLLVLTVLAGVVYPLGIWGVSRLPGLQARAEGSLLPGGVGSALIGVDPVPVPGTAPTDDPWFHLRPSASAPDDAPAGLGPADPRVSGGSNLAADSAALRDAVVERRAVIAAREAVAPEAVPADAVTASASGLDPHVSPAYAALQLPRVARVTGLGEARVAELVAASTEGRSLGFLGAPRVNVSELNAKVATATPGAR